MKILVAICASFTLLMGQAIAQTPQQLKQQHEQEYVAWYLAVNALSACPHLIEDWVWQTMDAMLVIRERELTNERGIPAATKANLAMQANNIVCEDRRLTQEVQRLNQAARNIWYYYYTAYLSAPKCKDIMLLPESQPFTQKFGDAIIVEMVKQSDQDARRNLENQAENFGARLNEACLRIDPEKDNAKPTDIFQKIVQAPDDQRHGMNEALDFTFRIRDFQTPLGQTVKRHDFELVSLSKITARRNVTLEKSKLFGECSGHLSDLYNLIKIDSTTCNFEISRDGSAKITGGFGTVDLFNEELSIVDLMNEEMKVKPEIYLHDLAKNDIKLFVPVDQKGAFKVEGFIDSLRAASMSTVVYVKFGYDPGTNQFLQADLTTIRGAQLERMIPTISKDSNHVRVFLARDLVKAYNFAYGFIDEDASKSGVVATLDANK